MQKFDIIIIGGGVVGLTQACLFAQEKLSVLMIDKQTPPATDLKHPYDIRVSAIHHASQAIFNALDVWKPMMEKRVSRYSHMRVWDAQSPAQVEFDSVDMSQPCLGYIVEQSVMRQVLWQRLQQYPHVKILHSIVPVALSEKSEAVEVKLNNGSVFSASLLIGADGRDSWVASQMAKQSATTFKELSWVKKILPNHHRSELQGTAVVTTLRSEQPHRQTALQRFLTTGPVALLPLADPHLLSLVWSTTYPEAISLSACSENNFNAKLEQATEYTLGKLTICDQRATFPLFCHQANHYVKARMALVGDAAHTILPLAGQGLNLGLLDAACLAQVVIAAYRKQRDIGEVTMLRRYERWRKGENTAMLFLMEGFNRIFSSEAESMRFMRHTGFALTQKLPWLKNYFMARAMGLRGELPEIAKVGLHLL